MSETPDIESIRAAYDARFEGFSRVEICAGFDDEGRFRMWSQTVYGDGDPPEKLRLATPGPGVNLDREPEVDVAPILAVLRRDQHANGWKTLALTFYADDEILRYEDADADVGDVAYLMRDIGYDRKETARWERMTLRATREGDGWYALFLVERSDWLPPLVDWCSLPFASGGLDWWADRIVAAMGEDGATISDIVLTTTHSGRHELEIARDGERLPKIFVPTIEDYTRCAVDFMREHCPLEGHHRLYFGVMSSAWAATVIDDSETFPSREQWVPEHDDCDRLEKLGNAIAVMYQLQTGVAAPAVVLDCVPGQEPKLRLEAGLD